MRVAQDTKDRLLTAAVGAVLLVVAVVVGGWVLLALTVVVALGTAIRREPLIRGPINYVRELTSSLVIFAVFWFSLALSETSAIVSLGCSILALIGALGSAIGAGDYLTRSAFGARHHALADHLPR